MKVELISPSPKVGDLAEFSIQLPSGQWKLEQIAQNHWLEFGPIMVDASSLSQKPSTDNSVTIHFNAIVLEPGQNTIPPITFYNNGQTIITDPTVIQTASRLSAQEKQPAYTLGPISYGSYNYTFIAELSALFIFILIILFFIFRKKGTASILVMQKNQREEALDHILAMQDFLQKNNFSTEDLKNNFAYPLASCLKKYCERNYKANLKTLTDTELLEWLRGHIQNVSALTSMEGILNELNEICYSAKNIGVDKANALLQEATKFINTTYDNDYYNISIQKQLK